MLRDKVLARLTSAFGAPLASSGADRWCLERVGRGPIRVCLFRRERLGRAQILVFDPAQIEGDSVLGISIEREEELSPLVERVRFLVVASRFVVRQPWVMLGTTKLTAQDGGTARCSMGEN